MAQALAKGFLKADLIKIENIKCSTPSKAKSFQNIIGEQVETFIDNTEVYYNSDIIVLAIKPQYLKQAMDSIELSATKKFKDPFIISIIAGITLENLSKMLPNNNQGQLKIARVMTNTPSLFGKGISVYSTNSNCNIKTLCKEKNIIDCDNILTTLFSSVGICEPVPESLMNSYGGLIGSGPAYVFIMIEALADGGVKMGIPRATALKFAAHLLLGSAELMLQSGKHPAELKDAVCSPGGTTISAVHVLEKFGIRNALISAVEASTTRGRDISKEI
ncbi:unnamed protein product [Gordionus sp. m RMFG-2023]